MDKSRIIIKNFILLFTSNVLGQLFFLGGLIHLARVLGPGGFGLWNFAQAWLMYFFRGGEMGLEVVGVREIARNPSDTPRLISAVVFSRFMLVIVLLVFVVLASKLGLFPMDSIPLVLTFSLAIIPMAFILEWVFEGHQNLSNVSIARIAKGFFFFLLVVLFVKSTEELVISALFYIISITIPIIYIGLIALKNFGCVNIRKVISLFPYLWKSAIPIGLATLLSNYNLLLGTMVIGYTMQHEQMGYYTASHRIMLFLWAYIISNLQRVVLPTLSTHYQASHELFKYFVENFLRYITFISFGIGVLMTALSGSVIQILYSATYNPSIQILQILVWAFAMASVRMIFEIALLAAEKQNYYFFGMAFVAIIYTILTPWLISLFGIAGAAYAAVIAESLYLILLVAIWCRERKADIWKYLIKSCVAACIAVTVVIAFPMNVIVSVFCAIGIYLILTISLKLFSLIDFIDMYNLVKSVIIKKIINVVT